ncbi:MFS transporter [Planctomycetales bacterium 10988]|nr:MFS transporter [Planctomycetales bacterium 10988]
MPAVPSEQSEEALASISSPFDEDPPLRSKTPPLSPEILQHQKQNFIILSLYQIFLRIGRVFKTDSVIMPAFLDFVMPAGWLRGCLPMLNRFGQSVPPLLFSGYLKRLPRKRNALMFTTLGMAIPFYLLGILVLIYSKTSPGWMSLVFLILYTVFFSLTGLSQLCYGTVQGKLVQTTRYGRLVTFSTLGGAIPAVLAAWWLMPGWLTTHPGLAFENLFFWTATLFLVSGLLALFLFEPAQEVNEEEEEEIEKPWSEVWRLARFDKSFRKFIPLAMIYSSIIILFPHYQALGHERFTWDDAFFSEQLMIWVVVQNLSAGLVSVFIGPLGDRRGNRLALRMIFFLAMLGPLLALYWVQHPQTGEGLYWTVFAILGLTPVGVRLLYNYTLEIGPAEEHPHYLSATGLCLAVPLGFSPIVGLLIDALGFEIIFLCGSALIGGGGFLTFRLDDPRRESPG